MAKLEIHHADGKVTYAELSQDKPLMIGSASNCDVVLEGQGIKRVHCRIVRRDSRWRIEVAADAGGVQLGDKLVKAGTVRPGDVIGIGDCRIYVDAAEAATVAAAEPAPYSDVLGEPAAAMDAEPEEQYLGRGVRKSAHMKDQRGVWQRAWSTIRRTASEQLKGEVDRAPGEERILGSPLVRWLLVGVAVVGLLGFVFYQDFRNRTINAHFDRAQKAMGEGNWEGAIGLFKTFEEQYPTHTLASAARVQRALCEIEGAGSPLASLEVIRKTVRERSEEKAWPDALPKIGDAVVRVSQNLMESARDRSDEKAFQHSQEAHDILRKDLGGAGFTEDSRNKYEETTKQAQAAIQKFNEHQATLAAMDKALADGSVHDAYAARESIVQRYRDLVDEKTYEDKDEEIRNRMIQANTLDRDSVRWESAVKNAETEPRGGPVVASTLLINRTGPDAGAADGDEVVFVLSGGIISAHNVANGKLAWSMVVGNDATTLPVPVPGAAEPTVIVTDARHDELAAVRSRTGQLVWRQPIGERLIAAPLLHRSKIYQPTGGGKLFVIDASTGRIDGHLQFTKQRFTTTPTTDRSGQFLYLLGEQYVLYLLRLGSPTKCESVYYLAHRPDSIIASPLRMDRYLVLCENDSAANSRLRVFLLSTDGNSIEEIQRTPAITGWIHATPAVQGNLIFVATDVETVEVYSGGAPEKAEGFKKLTAAAGGTAPSGTRPQAYSLAYSEKDLLVVGSRVRHYDFKAEQQVLAPTREDLPGAASQPIQRYPATGRPTVLVVARRAPNRAAILLTALSGESLEPRWEVEVGTELLSVLPTNADASAYLALTRSGRVVPVSADNLAAGGVLDQPPQSSDAGTELSDQFEPVVLADGSAVFAPAGDANRLFVRDSAAAIRTLDVLAPLAASPVVYESGLLLPATDGRLYFRSADGKQLAEPFQPPLEPTAPPTWRGVGLSNKNTIVAADNRGNVYQLELRKEPLPHLTIKRDALQLPRPIRSRLAVAGHVICCVDEDNTLHTVHTETLDPIATMKLPAPASLGPVAAGDHLFVAAGNAEILCITPEGQEAWRFELDGQTVAGRPIVHEGTVYFITAAGHVYALKLTDGSKAWNIDAERPLANGPLALKDSLVVIGNDGSLNTVKPPVVSN